MSDQIEFSSFFRLLNSIKEGNSEKISLLDEKISEFKNGNSTKSFLEQLGALYLSIGITELYKYTNQQDLHSIGLIDKEVWEKLSIKKEEVGELLECELRSITVSLQGVINSKSDPSELVDILPSEEIAPMELAELAERSDSAWSLLDKANLTE